MPDQQQEKHTETAKSPARIRQLLERVRQSGNELQVQLEGSEETWRTTISRVDADANQILYGQLTPATWQEQPGMQKPARILCPVKETSISYSALLTPAVDDESVRYLQSTLPEQLLHHQLRRQLRISLTGRESTVQVTTETGALFSGEIVNISGGGCRCCLQGSSEILGDQRQLLRCDLSIPGLLELDFQSRICHVQDTDRGLMLSLAFVELPPASQRKLQRCIVQLERHTMRTHRVV